MYVTTRHAAAWLDTSTIPAPVTTRHTAPPTAQVIQARKAFECPKGRCVAVKLVESASPEGAPQLFVGLANTDPTARGPRWLPASQVLTAQQADRWARTGF